MSGPWLLDTNVLVYAFDTGEPTKQRAALTLLDSDDASRFVLSAQVLGEFYVTVTRKLKVALSPKTAADAVARFAQLPIVPIDNAMVQAAIATSQSAQLSYWDAMIIEAAATAGCDRILTEDLATGSTIRGVKIINPFG